jgi:predicted phosphoribosyltransferase
VRPYDDRFVAGDALAGELRGYAGRDDVLVLGLPRGGVPVAGRVAAALEAPLDVLVVRKLGLPGQPELAMGAVAGLGERVEVVRNARLAAGATEEQFDAVLTRESAEVRRRQRAYRGDRPPPRITGRAVIVVDDGLATGASMRAALAALNRHRPWRVVVAAPIGAPDTCVEIAADVDEVVCPWTPADFVAVGQGYRDFSPTSGDQVRTMLSWHGYAAGGPHPRTEE